MYDIDGKTFSLHVRLSEQSHSTFALVVPSEIYVRLSGLSEISIFCGFNPQFLWGWAGEADFNTSTHTLLNTLYGPGQRLNKPLPVISCVRENIRLFL